MTPTTVAILLDGMLAVILAAQVAGTWRFIADFRRACPGHGAATAWPRAAVVMAIRGGDESIRDSLQRFMDLDYPDFEIHVVADNIDDPTIRVVDPWGASHCPVQCHSHVLTEISPHASLKCSAVRQCLLTLDESVEVAVVVDLDSRVYPGWLHDLVATMRARDAGLVSGNRWYAPQAGGWGSLARFIYNAHAVVPMHLATMPWGGSLAIHRRVFTMARFGDILWHAPTEDAAVREFVRSSGLPCVMQPRVLLMNDDGIGLVDCYRFIRRQLIWTRLYHPGWTAVLVATVATHGVLATQTCAAAWAAWRGDAVAAAGFAAGPVLAAAVSLGLMLALHRTIVAGVPIPRGTRIGRISGRDGVRLLAALPIALATISLAAVGAACARSVEWSGIRYVIAGPGRLRLTSYRPHRS